MSVEFGEYDNKGLTIPVIVIPAGVNCSIEVYTGPKEGSRLATSGVLPFVSTGHEQQINAGVIMPANAGIYHVYAELVFGMNSPSPITVLHQDKDITIYNPVSVSFPPNLPGVGTLFGKFVVTAHRATGVYGGGFYYLYMLAHVDSTEAIQIRAYYRGTYKGNPFPTLEIVKAAAIIQPGEMFNYTYIGYFGGIFYVNGIPKYINYLEPYLARDSQYYVWLEAPDGSKTKQALINIRS